MARATTELWDESTRGHMRRYFHSLSEKDRRRYAAVEAVRLGYGGIQSVADLLGCSTRTIARGIEELDSLDNDPATGRVRRPGAGRKKSSHPTHRLSGI